MWGTLFSTYIYRRDSAWGYTIIHRGTPIPASMGFSSLLQIYINGKVGYRSIIHDPREMSLTKSSVTFCSTEVFKKFLSLSTPGDFEGLNKFLHKEAI